MFGLEAMAKAARAADEILNFVLSVIIILALLFGCFALWDTYRIYDDAGIDSELLKYKPTVEASGPTLSELVARNADVRAWLTIDDTGIDYPVVQGTTNMDYINTDVYGEYSLSGSIFIDCRNASDLSDFYTLLYGHHMEGSAMFGDLAKFYQDDYFDRHTTGMLYTESETYRLEIYALLSVDAYDPKVFDPAAQDGDILNYIRENALQYREIHMSAEDRLIGFSTCSDAVTNGRTVVFARLTDVTNLEVTGTL